MMCQMLPPSHPPILKLHEEFQRAAFDMVKVSNGNPTGGIHGDIALPNNEHWMANHYWKNGAWNRVSVDNQVTWDGPVKSGINDNEVAKFGVSLRVRVVQEVLTSIVC